MCVRHSRERVLRKVLLLWDERCVLRKVSIFRELLGHLIFKNETKQVYLFTLEIQMEHLER